MRPPVAAGPMLRHCSCERSVGSTADEGADTTDSARTAARKKRATRIARLSYDPRRMTARILRTAALIAISLCTRMAAGADAACDRLRELKLPNASITAAESIAAGAFVQPAAPRGGPPGGNARAYADLPRFCRVAATLTPSSDSDIKIEGWLPATDWNGKFLAVGNGGWA